MPINIDNLDYNPNFEQKSATVFEKSKVTSAAAFGTWNFFKPMRMVHRRAAASGKMHETDLVHGLSWEEQAISRWTRKPVAADAIPHSTFK